MIGRRRLRRLFWAALTVMFGAITVSATVTAAQDERPIAEALTIAPQACLTAARLAPDIARNLGRDFLDRRAAVDIAAESNGVRVTILYDGTERGVRHIRREPRCSDYVGVVAISVAMALDALIPHEAAPPPSPDAGVDAEEPRERPEAPAAPAPTKPPPRIAPEIVKPPPEKPGELLEPAVRVSLDTSSNLLPTEAAALASAVSVRGGPLGIRWRLGSSFVFPKDISVGPSIVRATALLGRLDGCVAPLPRGVRGLHLCTGLLAGAVLARGTTPEFARSSRVPLVLPSLGVELAVPVTHGFGVVFGAEALFGVVRPELVVSGNRGGVLGARRADLVGWLLRLGIEWND